MADRLAELKKKYQSVFGMIEQQQVRLRNVHLENEKLLIRGEAPSAEAKNRVWDQIKAIDPGHSDLAADISVNASLAPDRKGEQADMKGMYTVQPGDTLSAISKRFYGNPNEYMKIFNANRDQLNDPDKIQSGQKLVIPAA